MLSTLKHQLRRPSALVPRPAGANGGPDGRVGASFESVARELYIHPLTGFYVHFSLILYILGFVGFTIACFTAVSVSA